LIHVFFEYRRIVGVVSVNGVNVNESLISNGFAWQYRKYCKASFCDDWLDLEKETKASRIGLWADHDPVPPWEWRRGVHNTGSTKSGTVKSKKYINW
jgi:endonuclease YncB( thermonuclease family)